MRTGGHSQGNDQGHDHSHDHSHSHDHEERGAGAEPATTDERPQHTVGAILRRWFTPLSAAVLFVVVQYGGSSVGRSVASAALGHFASFAWEMMLIIPAAFVLVGLFETWIPQAVVEQHLGHRSGAGAYGWAIVLAGTTVGGLYVSFPIAAALSRKGARLGVVFAYVGLSGVCRVPMTLFEMSFLGVEFTLVRYATAVPLIIVTSHLMGRYLDARGYRMPAVPE